MYHSFMQATLTHVQVVRFTHQREQDEVVRRSVRISMWCFKVAEGCVLQSSFRNLRRFDVIPTFCLGSRKKAGVWLNSSESFSPELDGCNVKGCVEQQAVPDSLQVLTAFCHGMQLAPEPARHQAGTVKLSVL